MSIHQQPANSGRYREADSLKLHVSCLPAKMDREELWRYFRQFGQVRDIRFPPPVHRISDDKTIGIGFCTLELSDLTTKLKILNHHHHIFAGRSIKVEPHQHGNQLKEKNLLGNQTRLFLKRFPSGTQDYDVETWLAELNVFRPTCIYTVFSKKDQTEFSSNRTVTFNVQCNTIEDSEWLISHPRLEYRGSRIKVEPYQVSRPREEGQPGIFNHQGNTSGGHNSYVRQDKGMRSPYRPSPKLQGEILHKRISGGPGHAVARQNIKPGSASSIDKQYSTDSMLVPKYNQSVGFADRQVPRSVFSQHAGDKPGTVSQIGYIPKSQFSFPAEPLTEPEAESFGTNLRYRSTYCTNNANLLGEQSANLRFNIIALKKAPISSTQHLSQQCGA